MTASKSGPFPFLPRNFLYFTIGLQSIGFIFQITGTALLAGSSSLSASQVGADVAVAGLAIQILTLTLACGACVTVGFWIFANLRDLRLRRSGAVTSRESDLSGYPNHSKKFKAHVAGRFLLLAHKLYIELTSPIQQ